MTTKIREERRRTAKEKGAITEQELECQALGGLVGFKGLYRIAYLKGII